MKKFIALLISLVIVATFAYPKKVLYKKGLFFQDKRLLVVYEIYASDKKSRMEFEDVETETKSIIITHFHDNQVIDIYLDPLVGEYYVEKTPLSDFYTNEAFMQISRISCIIKNSYYRFKGENFRSIELKPVIKEGDNLIEIARMIMISIGDMFPEKYLDEYKNIMSNHLRNIDRSHYVGTLLAALLFPYFSDIKDMLLQGYVVVNLKTPDKVEDRVEKIDFIDYNENYFIIPRGYKKARDKK